MADTPRPSAVESYDWWAEAYDECNSENDYEAWLGKILLPQLQRLGLRRGRALDIGCGTGLAFPPLLDRGWELVGCDASEGMLEAAGQKFGDAVRLLKLDARELPAIGQSHGAAGEAGFDLVLMLNDVINYLTEDGDLDRVFASIERNLGPQGLAIFDANTAALFRRDYRQGVSEDIGANGWRWHGLTAGCGREQMYEGALEDPSGLKRRHRQRHWFRDQIGDALTAAGLRCLSVLGQREEGGKVKVTPVPSEERDLKTIYIVARGDR
jgi:SAM-dependent methyltransferase